MQPGPAFLGAMGGDQKVPIACRAIRCAGRAVADTHRGGRSPAVATPAAASDCRYVDRRAVGGTAVGRGARLGSTSHRARPARRNQPRWRDLATVQDAECRQRMSRIDTTLGHRCERGGTGSGQASWRGVTRCREVLVIGYRAACSLACHTGCSATEGARATLRRPGMRYGLARTRRDRRVRPCRRAWVGPWCRPQRLCRSAFDACRISGSRWP